MSMTVPRRRAPVKAKAKAQGKGPRARQRTRVATGWSSGFLYLLAVVQTRHNRIRYLLDEPLEVPVL